MADTREKLVELLRKTEINVVDGHSVLAEVCFVPSVFTKMADHLIANGVTVQNQEGCNYCQQFDDPCGVPMIAEEDSDADRGIYLYNGFLCANGGEFCEAKVSFCPMCGRKLAEPPKGE